ncbi:hypothetical protein ACN9MB_05405 [Dyella kyungheensis]|uniref:hypothetical protein n=1 Tax=Dyella kyungheensis TaxID=1242174 RepID=UPI003CF7AF90
MIQLRKETAAGWLALAIALFITATVYWPGLSGTWLFDDYPNIVDNNSVHLNGVDLRSIVGVMLSSPASEFRRPLASLSFGLSYLASGINPFGWKLANLIIHLINGALVFALTRLLVARTTITHDTSIRRRDLIAAFVAAGWMLLPINVTAVLYVVQREESLANLFVLIGLVGYVKSRIRMVEGSSPKGWYLCALSIIIPTAIGLMVKETAVMLPLYAAAIEWVVFDFRNAAIDASTPQTYTTTKRYDKRLFALFLVVLVIPGLVGLAWILPRITDPAYWVTRAFTLKTRLFSEARVVCEYLNWTILPSPQALSFYHDDFRISSNIISPWTTLTSVIALLTLLIVMVFVRRRFALVSLGIAFFLGGQLLTATVLPLELVFEHRNYFPSFGAVLAILPLLLPAQRSSDAASAGMSAPMDKLRCALLVILMLNWASQTALTSYAWGSPLRLAQEFSQRAPSSSRAQYELGRVYVILSQYNRSSPFVPLAYEALERAAALPDSTILPEQGLIFMNSRMHLPLEGRWWDSMVAKLKKRKSAVEDESALEQLSTCQTNGQCDLPKERMLQAYLAALSHPNPSARLLNSYGSYAWEELSDHDLAIRMMQDAVTTNPKEPAYRVTLIRMLTDKGRLDEARQELRELQPLNIGGRMDAGIAILNQGIASKEKNGVQRMN